MTAKADQGKNTLRRFTNGDFFQSFDQPWATLCQVLHRQWLDFFTVISLQGSLPSVCTAMSVHLHLTCLVLSHQVHLSHTIYIQLYKLYNYTSIHSYIHTLTLSCIQQHMHNINSYMVASVTQSLISSYPFSSVLNCFKWKVLNNGQLESTFHVFVSSG